VKTYSDPRDGNIYKVIYVNGAWWMVDNLNYLPLDKAVAEQEGELPHVIGTSASKYGKFYSAEVASQACPSGWKLPSAKDWESLLTSMPFPVVQKLFSQAQSGETALLAKGFKSLLSGWVMNKTHFMVGQTENSGTIPVRPAPTPFQISKSTFPIKSDFIPPRAKL
jgi:uncharacterized protein (TIGR02145 family)